MADKKGASRGARAISVELVAGKKITVYAGQKILDALDELQKDMTLYHGVRLSQVAEAVYEQGLKNGRAEAFAELDRAKEKPELKFRNPGRPAGTQKKSTPKKTAPKRPVKKPVVKSPSRRGKS